MKFECLQIDQQDFQQDFQLFINDRVFTSTLIAFASLFDFLCFNNRSFQRHSTSHRDRMKRSSLKEEKFQLIALKRS